MQARMSAGKPATGVSIQAVLGAAGVAILFAFIVLAAISALLGLAPSGGSAWLVLVGLVLMLAGLFVLRPGTVRAGR